MTPFLEFRLWWRRTGPVGRATTAGVAALVLALLVWIAVPSGNNASSVTSVLGGEVASGTTGGRTSSGATLPGGVNPGGPEQTVPAGGSAETGGSGAAGTGTATQIAQGQSTPTQSGTGSATSTPTGATGATGATGTTPSTTPSCTGNQGSIKIGVVIISIGGTLNATFGAPGIGSQMQEWAAVFDAANKAGGAACHTLVPDYQTYNELDTTTAQSACLQFVQAKVYAVLFGFLPTGTDDCVLQNHIPLIEEVPVSESDVQRYFPYYFSTSSSFQTLYKNFADAAQQRGAFSAAQGFKKLGLLYRDCQSDVNQAMVSDLGAAGVPSASISKYDLGCPANFASPTELEAAVLQFKGAGVTTMTVDNDIEDLQSFTNIAQAQGFTPHWVLPDYGEVAVTNQAAFAPNPHNFAGALAITPTQYGAPASGLPENAQTMQCDKIMTGHGLPPVLQSPDDYAGSVCNHMTLLVDGIDHAPDLSPAHFYLGVQANGPITFSFSDGPAEFGQPGVTTGGQYWRPLTFLTSCACWKVDSPTFQPPF